MVARRRVFSISPRWYRYVMNNGPYPNTGVSFTTEASAEPDLKRGRTIFKPTKSEHRPPLGPPCPPFLLPRTGQSIYKLPLLHSNVPSIRLMICSIGLISASYALTGLVNSPVNPSNTECFPNEKLPRFGARKSGSIRRRPRRRPVFPGESATGSALVRSWKPLTTCFYVGSDCSRCSDVSSPRMGQENRSPHAAAGSSCPGRRT